MNDGDNLFIGLLCAGLACVVVILVDGWFLRPQRDPGATSVDEPLLPKMAGYALMALALAMLWRLFRYEAVDFSLMLVIVGALSGVIWGLDRLFFSSRRRRTAAAAGTPAERVREPIAVEYARSFFPVILLVLVIRSFLFEPFRIPSDSMMPTLFDGDFIFVSKYSYGLRLPVSNTLVVPTGTPQRGDVIVFRLPPNPKINYIKRLIGLPGDRIRVDARNQLYVNDVPMKQDAGPSYTGPSRTCGIMPVRPPPPRTSLRSAISSCSPTAASRRGSGRCPPASISSWETTATTARTAAGRANQMLRGSFPRPTWSAKPCVSGLISILVTDLSGDASGMRFNERLKKGRPKHE